MDSFPCTYSYFRKANFCWQSPPPLHLLNWMKRIVKSGLFSSISIARPDPWCWAPSQWGKIMVLWFSWRWNDRHFSWGTKYVTSLTLASNNHCYLLGAYHLLTLCRHYFTLQRQSRSSGMARESLVECPLLPGNHLHALCDDISGSSWFHETGRGILMTEKSKLQKSTQNGM